MSEVPASPPSPAPTEPASPASTPGPTSLSPAESPAAASPASPAASATSPTSSPEPNASAQPASSAPSPTPASPTPASPTSPTSPTPASPTPASLASPASPASLASLASLASPALAAPAAREAPSPAPAPGTIGPDAPALDRLLLWSKERFPLPVMLVFSAVVVATAAGAASALADRPVVLDVRFVLATAGYLLTLLFLRLLDEHKDHAKDAVAYPERALSRGIVTLPLLGRAAVVVAGLALLQSAGLGLPALVAYVVVLVFALLMAKEFFIGRLLERDVFVYAATHQPINPLVTAWLLIGLGTVPGDPSETTIEGALRALLPAAALPFLGAELALGFGFEVARKLWTPAEERPDLVQSYSSHDVGPRGAAWIALAMLLAGCALTLTFARQQGLPAWVIVPVLLCALLCVTSVGRFARSPFAGASKKLQGAVGLGTLVLHAGLVAGIIAKHGLHVALLPEAP